MEIKKLQLINYKNYEEVNLDFDLKINVLVGKNGSGKTNLLDAIYYLSLTKSAFASSDNHCVKQAESYFMVKGVFQKDTPKEIIGSFQAGKKNFKEDKVD
jgi:DNA replication and repair protein RecF